MEGVEETNVFPVGEVPPLSNFDAEADSAPVNLLAGELGDNVSRVEEQHDDPSTIMEGMKESDDNSMTSDGEAEGEGEGDNGTKDRISPLSRSTSRVSDSETSECEDSEEDHGKPPDELPKTVTVAEALQRADTANESTNLVLHQHTMLPIIAIMTMIQLLFLNPNYSLHSANTQSTKN
jgi:hypothetical protein